MSPVVFMIMAVLLVAAALGVVLNRSPIRSALWLVVTMFLLAVMFLLLDAHMVAALQVIVYAGAVVVLFQGELDSYLIEITRDILGYKDNDGKEVIDLILDAAGQKGTGKWTVVAALDDGMPLTLIGEAVFARCLSAVKEERVAASQQIPSKTKPFKGDKKKFVNDLRQALYASKIVSYAQRYQLMRAAAKTYNWNLNNGGIALMWRGGCIIRSVFLGDIKKAFKRNPGLVNLLLDKFFN